MKLLTGFLLFFPVFVALGDSSGYFDLDNKLDSLVINYSNNELNACINTSKLKTKRCFTISAENEDPEGLSFGLDVYNGLKGEVIVDEHCCGIDKRFYVKFYRYSPKINNWLLYKKVNYGAILDDNFNYTDQYLERKYITDSQVDISGKKHINSLVKEYKKESVEARIKYLLDIKIKNTRVTFFEVNEWFFLLPLSKENLSNYNDIAYYLQKQENHKLAIFILAKILSKFPDRVVAYLNIADSQMAMELEEDALKNYEEYLKLMKQKGKFKKVPKRVLKYLNNSDLSEKSSLPKELAPQTKAEPPKLVEVTNQALEKNLHKSKKVGQTKPTKKAESIKTATGSISLAFLSTMLGLLAWRLS